MRYISDSRTNEIYYEPFMCTNPSSGISFVNVTNLILTNITFANCGITTDNRSAVFSTYDVMIEGVSIQNATGYGILQYDSILPQQHNDIEEPQ